MSNEEVQKQTRSLSCESVATTTTGSDAALTAQTNFFKRFSVKAFCITTKRLSATGIIKHVKF